MNLTRYELRYIAGYFDAEGCFQCRSSGISVHLETSHYPTMEWIAGALGGKLVQISRARQEARYRPKWSFTLIGKEARAVCELLHPYLKEKKRQVDCLIAVHKTMQPRGGIRFPVAPEILALRAEMDQLCRKYKREKPRPREAQEPLSSDRSEDLAYAAGFIDGEGHFDLKRNSLEVGNTYGPAIQWLQELFGGRIKEHHHTHPNRQNLWYFKITSARACATAKELVPHLREKRSAAEQLSCATNIRGEIS